MADEAAIRQIKKAIRDKDVEAVRVILERAADLQAVLNPCDAEFSLPLAYAASFGDIQVMHILLEADADVNQVNAWGDYAINAAIENSQLSAVAFLTENGAAVNVRDGHGDTPLTNALYWANELHKPEDIHAHQQIISLLRKLGATE